jgi:Ca2+-binding RTX toxin-like protein
MVKRGIALLTASLALLVLGAAPAGAATISIVPQTPSSGTNTFPFGHGTTWNPFAAFIYRNIPAFELKPGDTVAFDMRAENGTNIEMDYDFAPTTFNGSDVAAAPFTRVILNTQTPANPKGDSIEGNFELQYKATTPFSFPGGGLIIRLSNPSPAFAADTTTTQNLRGADASDSSGFFLKRSTSDPDGQAPWANSAGGNEIAAFRLTTADEPPAGVSKCQGKDVTISGSDAGETIKGTQAADVINAQGGNDTVRAGRGNDTVCGGDGKDKISGAAGRDKMNGEGGADVLKGGKGKDVANGGPGRDTLIGGPKKDVCVGGPGKDTVTKC